jgi:four helix bundle protein
MDMDALKANPLCYRLVSQQIASADSICANIEEGCGRLSRIEYVRFLDIIRGSAARLVDATNEWRFG